MSNIARGALGSALACLALTDAAAAPAFRILYHEALNLEMHAVAGQQQRMSFDAYGRRFNLVLQSNEGIRRAVPVGRTDIEPLTGTLEGQRGSWVRMTRTRSGWRGVISDGRDLYAIEPSAEIAAAVVQPLGTTSNTAPVIYRFADALLPITGAFCEIIGQDGTPLSDSGAVSPGKAQEGGSVTAQTLYKALADQGSQSPGPGLRLRVGVVADYEFFRQFSDDPEGTIISRMDIVDGIYSSQVGVKISLAPLTVFTVANEPFTKTDPADLLAQVRQFRSSQPTQMALGVTHLMTGRDLDGDIVGISYLGSVCNGDGADSLSEGAHSTSMSALIVAHELGHNFNAPHDGVPGACATTPQTYLMAPKINFSSQFSDCSLQQIHARIQSAECLTPYTSPDVTLNVPTTAIAADANSLFTLSFMAQALGDDPSQNVTVNGSLPAGVTMQSAVLAGGTCTGDNGAVTCTLGTLQPGESRKIALQLMAATSGTSSVMLSVASSNESVTANDSAQVALNISNAGPDTAPVSGGGSDSPVGGGGGGQLDFALLAFLSCAVAASLQRSRSGRAGRLS